jgi:hypothetical protein
MNKLLTIILLFTIMFSCSNDNITISKEEYGKLKGDTIRAADSKTFKVDEEKYNVSLGSDGHEYYSMSIAVIGFIYAIDIFIILIV